MRVRVPIEGYAQYKVEANSTEGLLEKILAGEQELIYHNWPVVDFVVKGQPIPEHFPKDWEFIDD